MYLACNTSAGQAVGLEAVQNEMDVPVGMRDAIWEVVNELLESTEPLNISSVVTLWFDIADEVLRALAPDGLTPSTGGGIATGWLSDIFTHFSSVGFSYNGISLIDLLIVRVLFFGSNDCRRHLEFDNRLYCRKFHNRV